jgi:hypothetical protein
MIDLAYIRRIDQDSRANSGATHTWLVVVPGAEGEWRKSFGDGPHAGTLPALLAAVRWRDEMRGGRPTDVRWVEEGLERVERGGIRGWWVSYRRGEVLDADLFEDAEYGGVKPALEAALQWRVQAGPPGSVRTRDQRLKEKPRKASSGAKRNGAPKGKKDRRRARVAKRVTGTGRSDRTG